MDDAIKTKREINPIIRPPKSMLVSNNKADSSSAIFQNEYGKITKQVVEPEKVNQSNNIHIDLKSSYRSENSSDIVEGEESEDEKIMVEDLDEEVLQKFTVLESKITSTNENIQDFKKIIENVQGFLTDFVKSQIEGLITKLSDIDSKVDLNYKSSLDRISIEAKYRLRDNSDININISKLSQNIEHVSKRIDDYMVDNSKIRKFIQILVIDAQIQQQLDEADEVDRKSMALYGVTQQSKATPSGEIQK